MYFLMNALQKAEKANQPNHNQTSKDIDQISFIKIIFAKVTSRFPDVWFFD